jgi:predicted DsbA family dithiol-disulfide isomerase
MGDLHVEIYTDPACPWSWAAEPALRRLQTEFAADLRITYVMGGLAREFARPEETMRHWLDVAAESAMPVDPRLWLDAPPSSSYPACLAVKAAAEQGLDGAYLRRAREGLAYERRTLDAPEALVDLARGVAGLDVERFRRDLASSAIVEAFGADLERARSAAPELRGDRPRVAFPSARFAGPAGEAWAYDAWDPVAWHDAARAAGGTPSAAAPPGPAEALRRFGSMAATEVAAVCGLPGPTAPAELWQLAARWQARVERHPCGEVFRPA